jgi:hypothetical protein
MKNQPIYCCSECGCWITSGPLMPYEARQWLRQRCPDCGEPLSKAIACDYRILQSLYDDQPSYRRIAGKGPSSSNDTPILAETSMA